MTTPATSKPLTVRLPFHTVSEANTHQHWRPKAERVKAQRGTVAAYLRLQRLPALPAVVTLTRCSPGTLDGDNLAAGLKAIRDGVADAYSINDRDPRLTWCYEQRREAAYCVEITITTAKSPKQLPRNARNNGG